MAIVCGLRTMGRAITMERTKLYGSAIQSGLTLQIAMYSSEAQKKRYQGDMEIVVLVTSSKLIEKVKSQSSLCILCEKRIEHWLSISLKLQSFRLWHIKAFQRVATCYIPPLPCPRSEPHFFSWYENRRKNDHYRLVLRVTANKKSARSGRFNYRM